MAVTPGPLYHYPTRAAHARAHRLAAERRRRDRRRTRAGREPISAMHYVTLGARLSRLDLSPLIAAFDGFAKSMAQAGEAMRRVVLKALVPSVPAVRALPAPSASTEDSARGFGADLLIIDEAFVFADEPALEATP